MTKPRYCLVYDEVYLDAQQALHHTTAPSLVWIRSFDVLRLVWFSMDQVVAPLRVVL